MIFGRNKTVKALEIRAEFNAEGVVVTGRDFQRKLTFVDFAYYLAGVAAHNANQETCGGRFRTAVVPYVANNL